MDTQTQELYIDIADCQNAILVEDRPQDYLLIYDTYFLKSLVVRCLMYRMSVVLLIPRRL